MSVFIGRDRKLTQGPGGNTSLKYENFCMVKASGKWLSRAYDEAIFTTLFREYKSFRVLNSKTSAKPSIEWPLHTAIQSKYVAHYHSVNSIAISFSSALENFLEQNLNVCLIPYLRPGKKLAHEIVKKLNTNIHNSCLLKNHGFLIWGEEAESLIKHIQEMENLISNFLQKQLGIQGKKSSYSLNGFITPEHSIFFKEPNDYINYTHLTGFKADIAKSIQDSLELLGQHDQIEYISRDEVKLIRNWPAEKYRINAQ